MIGIITKLKSLTLLSISKYFCYGSKVMLEYKIVYFKCLANRKLLVAVDWVIRLHLNNCSTNLGQE